MISPIAKLQKTLSVAESSVLLLEGRGVPIQIEVHPSDQELFQKQLLTNDKSVNFRGWFAGWLVSE